MAEQRDTDIEDLFGAERPDDDRIPPGRRDAEPDQRPGRDHQEERAPVWASDRGGEEDPQQGEQEHQGGDALECLRGHRGRSGASEPHGPAPT